MSESETVLAGGLCHNIEWRKALSFVISQTSSVLLILTAVALAGAAVGIWLTGAARSSRRVVPLSGGLLVGIGLFWVLPELHQRLGWAASGWLAAALVSLWAVDRYVYPVCPACSHTHDHASCHTRLHGFATPLVAAAAIHSLLDGWGIAAAGEQGSGELGRAVLAGIALHKAPEGLAFGVILRASLGSWRAALAASAVAQAPMLAGGVLESFVARHFGAHWMLGLLALAGASFLFLGCHAVHGEWKQRGMAPAVLTAATGAAGAAVLQHGFRLWLR